MKLYTTGKGHWAGTQADARKLKKEHGVSCDMHEVPVAKGELLDFLNGNTVITDRFCKPSETSVPHIAPKEIAVPEDVPTRAAATEEERGQLSDTQNYIGKTSVLAAGDGLGMGKFKLHIYFYTEAGGY